jgi:hypothetical protein
MDKLLAAIKIEKELKAANASLREVVEAELNTRYRALALNHKVSNIAIRLLAER